jgi:hypothetical protein
MNEILMKAAESDMRFARKHGTLLIGRTKFGTISLTYDKVAREYAIRCQNGGTFPGGMVGWSRLKAAGCCTRLQGMYVVVTE